MKALIPIFVGALGIATGVLITQACRADSTPKLPPGMLEQAQYEARRLFRVGSCEVWGLTYRKVDHVVSVCPPAAQLDGMK